MHLFLASLVAALLVFTDHAQAQLQIEITKGIDNPTPIAIVPFAWVGSGTSPDDVARIIDSDLARSGQFAPVSRRDMLSYPTTAAEIFFRDWRAIETDYVLIGRASPSGPGNISIDWELFDTVRQQQIAAGNVTGVAPELRMLAHRVADEIYEKLTGIPGAFATRLLYVSVTRNPGGKDFYRLTLADSDGARPIVLLESREPILAPSWSPDGDEVAYVSFETSRPRHI